MNVQRFAFKITFGKKIKEQNGVYICCRFLFVFQINEKMIVFGYIENGSGWKENSEVKKASNGLL